MPNLDQPAALFLLGFSITLAVVCTIALCRAAGKPRPVKSLPGDLTRREMDPVDLANEDRSPEDVDATLRVIAAAEAVCAEAWARKGGVA
jgi:hypothetical protein